MASHYYAVERGEQVWEVTIDTSTQTKTFEFAVNDADAPTQTEALHALDQIKLAIVNNDWYPA